MDWYDYGFRFYDPAIGRWHVIDAMTEKHYEMTPYHYCFNNPMLYIDVMGLDTFNINLSDRSIDRIAVEDSENHVYNIIDGETTTTHTLEINDEGQVEFPATGEGFGRYGTEDEGGDHYLEADAAAALFGLTAEMKKNDDDFQVDFGDMSDENGGAPGGDHKTHGGEKGYSGLCVDYRYLNNDNQSYWGNSTNSQFSLIYNLKFLNVAGKWGFNKNYVSNKDVWKIAIFQATPNGKKIGGHNNHGHLTFSE